MPIYSIIDVALLKEVSSWIGLALNKANDMIAAKISAERNMKVHQL